jgi:hypothetical protein
MMVSGLTILLFPNQKPAPANLPTGLDEMARDSGQEMKKGDSDEPTHAVQVRGGVLKVSGQQGPDKETGRAVLPTPPALANPKQVRCAMVSMLNGRASVNSSGKNSTSSKQQRNDSRRQRRFTSRQIKGAATVMMGVAIPLLSLGLSHTGGSLCREGGLAVTTLGVFAFLLMGCVLTVSLSHLAWAVEDITRSPRWASWLLAVTFDLLLVLGELVHVAAEASPVGAVVTTMMVAVAAMSMFLNCWAFLVHPTK